MIDVATLLHNWPQTIEAAQLVQQRLRAQVSVDDDFETLDLIAGIDVSYDIASNLTRAFIVLLRMTDLKPMASVMATQSTGLPYVPGFLSFREVPAILHAFAKLPRLPQLLMVDGQGIAHPRRFGIASHLGVLTNLPTIGVAKSRLVGRHAPLLADRGANVLLLDRGEQIGTVLRSKDNCNPLYISPGHRVGQASALALVQRCLTHYRLPEPTRLADKLSKEKPKTSGTLL